MGGVRGMAASRVSPEPIQLCQTHLERVQPFCPADSAPALGLLNASAQAVTQYLSYCGGLEQQLVVLRVLLKVELSDALGLLDLERGRKKESGLSQRAVVIAAQKVQASRAEALQLAQCVRVHKGVSGGRSSSRYAAHLPRQEVGLEDGAREHVHRLTHRALQRLNLVDHVFPPGNSARDGAEALSSAHERGVRVVLRGLQGIGANGTVRRAAREVAQTC